ncbi:MAG: bifunctional tetrahydrofolate synthase/dihydrofolate synthase [Candidatus Thiodiazotropha sp.]|jgi:dihydrofolate synthase / folylpolyglutamate synthase
MRFKNLDQWLNWQITLHPKEIDLGLARVAGVWSRLKQTGLNSPVVTVAGTNGKGSSVAMLERIYLQAGYRVGAYTSPHLLRYNERIRVNGEAVSDSQLCQAFDMIDRAREQTALTYFEFATLAALLLFAEACLDLIILEVGLGGRLDAVNIIDADVALITTIDLDHTDWLGDNRELIGLEKAGIMRSNRPVVLADRDMPESVLTYAGELAAKVYLANRDFHAHLAGTSWSWSLTNGPPRALPLPKLSGEAQLTNASAVMMVCELLQSKLQVNTEQLAEGLRQATLPGRLQLIRGSPTLLLDVAHNSQSVALMKHTLDQLDWPGEVYALFGLLQDKDAAAIVNILQPVVDHWFLLDLPGSRGQKAEQLVAKLYQAGVEVLVPCFQDFSSAFQAVRSAVQPQDLVLIFGSFLIVGDALQYLAAE